jgi:hypothetical protein
MPHSSTDSDEDDITSDEDDITEARASTFVCASILGTRQVTLSPLPADLLTALALPITFDTKLFEVTSLLAVATDCKLNVKDAGDLLLLRDWIFEELGAPYMWIIMLFVVEWDTLTNAQKQLYCMMLASWLYSYSKAWNSVLQHWLWEFLNDETKGFAPLHKVFAKINCCLDGNLRPVPRHRCLHRAQAPCPWPQDVPLLQG